MTITGLFESVVGTIKDDGTAIYLIKPEYAMDGIVNGILKCHGKICPCSKGLTLQLVGSLNGNVFEVENCELPTHSKSSAVSILEYISSRLTAAQIDAISCSCDNDLFSLCDREDGLESLKKALSRSIEGDRIAEHIYRRLLELRSDNKLSTLLLRYGVPFEKVMKIIRRGETVEELKKHPYKVFFYSGLSFRQADVFAREECGIQAYDIIRLKGLVRFALQDIITSGDTCCTLERLADLVNVRYHVPMGPTLLSFCVMDMPSFCGYQEAGGEPMVYLNHVWEEESSSVYHFSRLQQARKAYSQYVTAEETERCLGIQYTQEQKKAFDLLKTSGVKILTGPPGSGKTAVIRGLIHNFEANHHGKAQLAATTGMAARVMRVATGRNSETVHMMLHIVPYNGAIRGRDLNDPLQSSLIIVDEVSMMGIQIFSALLQAVQSGAILLLVGDEDQLESVEYGDVLRDLIRSGKAEVCRLTQVMRQSGSIRINADRINQGDNRIILDHQFRIISTTEETAVSQILHDYDPYRSQVICPVKKGKLGIENLNSMLQLMVNGTNDIIASQGAKSFRYQDKVIFSRTDYGGGYVNGDMGTVVDASKDGGLALAYYGGILEVSPEHLPDLELGYAITAHKSQGSEFDKVHIVLPRLAKNMMTRRLLYTAVSRAKEEVIIYNEGTAFEDAVRDAAGRRRYTKLGDILIQRKS